MIPSLVDKPKPTYLPRINKFPVEMQKPHAESATIPSSSNEVQPTADPMSITKPSIDSVYIESDEDDLDDLDDMLDEFDEPMPSVRPIAPAGTVGDEVLDEEWARKLQEGMADLLGDMNEDEKMQDQFAHLAKELNNAMTSTNVQNIDQSNRSDGNTSTNLNFQERIRQAMDRMKSSDEEVGAAVADSKDEDFLAEMLKQMQTSGGEGEEDFSSMLVGMMEQLTSKEILYEPMKELSEKYPDWIAKNETKESKTDMERYIGQYTIVREIVAKFEEPGYKDENEIEREYIIDRMQKMQNAGAPPQELIGDIPTGMGLGELDIADCAVQ